MSFAPDNARRFNRTLEKTSFGGQPVLRKSLLS
jgi:hypothetical protein